MFGGTKKIYHYPFDQIKVYNGIPQVRQGKLSNGTACLDVYLAEGEEHFNFQSKNKKTISLWIEEICKVFRNGGNAVYSNDEYDDDNDDDDDDSVLGAFKEVGEEFKDVGREFAEAFGFKFKKKPQSEKNNKNVKPMANIVNTGIKCPSCGKSLPINSRFCTSCGTAIGTSQGSQGEENVQEVPRTETQEVVCPACGKKLKPNLRFCTECGTEISHIPKEEMPIKQEQSSADETEKKSLSIEQQIELLEKLKSLVDAGIISQEEFEIKKKEIF